ncbi:MAG TPA: prepilin-type N-terminal cleavage/methylation domain-containing protein [Thermoanaerobaculia bacterium]|nr:prepilin-type N-terminal cleavage/methylation domain-containing protein [Thermoanaerobaculia bacterium]
MNETRASARDRPAIDPGQDGQEGFTVLELVVACVVLAVVMLFAAQGLREAQRQLTEAQRGVTRGTTQLAFALIRRDARSASSASTSGSAWSGQPLVLARPDGSRATYLVREELLERVVYDGAGVQQVRQIVARQVLLFRWRRRGPGLVEAELALRPPPRPVRALDRSALTTPEPPPLERLTVSLRSRSRSAW